MDSAWYTRARQYLLGGTRAEAGGSKAIRKRSRMVTVEGCVAIAALLAVSMILAPLASGIQPSSGAAPDEAGLLACEGQEKGNDEIYTVEPDGDNLTFLTDNDVRDGYPVWAAGGNKLAFESHRDNGSEGYVMDADGSSVTRLTHYGPQRTAVRRGRRAVERSHPTAPGRQGRTVATSTSTG